MLCRKLWQTMMVRTRKMTPRCSSLAKALAISQAISRSAWSLLVPIPICSSSSCRVLSPIIIPRVSSSYQELSPWGQKERLKQNDLLVPQAIFSTNKCVVLSKDNHLWSGPKEIWQTWQTTSAHKIQISLSRHRILMQWCHPRSDKIDHG